ncbi:MAG: flagellar biosynthesis repressor FlbT [Alphaproteobacteria bacterium]|nr:flagellar biosynthesis repressor FlbT [Alphaproteobacteria bacterium]
MPLKIELKPGERLIVGKALITNDKERTRFYIEGNVPILREKFVMMPNETNTPCKRVYYIIQEIYLEKNLEEMQEKYFQEIKDITLAAPSLLPFIDAISQDILCGNYYNALKGAMALIGKEKELMDSINH